ncbi:MAG: hypothetical protein FRX48_01128 [Lasallia pustulata]|uniref:Uncharacterized protein n=1 Tax=Lasallia pustulata TaxID=136370 RepID=A0A5M8PXA4_9LECA|nr:MAG: hypothetical protein FRX48_01128 [Lasallia pustulata]
MALPPAPADPSPLPTLSISLALNPPVHSRATSTALPTLTIEALLSSPQPITICTWHTILHPRQALQQRAFEIVHTATQTPVPQVSKKSKRPAVKAQMGGPDERLFVTLVPQVPYTVETTFGPEKSGGLEDADGDGRPVYGMRGLKNGRYTLRVRGGEGTGTVAWWRWGTKEENLKPAAGTEGKAGEQFPPLKIDAGEIAGVDFVVD